MKKFYIDSDVQYVEIAERQVENNYQENASIKGDIKSPVDYLLGLLDEGQEDVLDEEKGEIRDSIGFSKSRAVLSIDKTDRSITFLSNVYNQRGTIKVKGSLVQSNDLLIFGINNPNKTFTSRELSRMLRMNRSVFVDTDVASKIAANLEQLKVKVNTQFEDMNNFKGHKRASFEQKVKVEFDLTFDAMMPIWNGELAQKFKVEILFDVRDNSIEFWLESPELKELQDISIDKIFDRELSRIEDGTIIIVNL